MKRLVVAAVVLLFAASGWSGENKKNQNSVVVVPPPEVMPVPKDSIAVVNYVVFLTKLEVTQGSVSKNKPGKSGVEAALKIHVENHSEGALKGFEIKYLTLYKENSKDEINTYKLTLKEGKFPVEMALHTLKDLEFVCTAFKATKAELKSGEKVYGRILVRYNATDHFISTKPVEMKVNPSSDTQPEKTN